MCAPVFRLANNSTWCARSLYWRNIKIPISPLAETIEFRHTTLATSSLAFFLCHSFFDIHFFFFHGAAEENINYKNSVTLPPFLYRPLLSPYSHFSFDTCFLLLPPSPIFIFARKLHGNADLTLVIDITTSSNATLPQPPFPTRR